MPWSSGNIAVRTSQDPSSILTSVTAAVHAVDPTVAVAQPETMEQVRNDALIQDRLTTFLFVSFALIALLLSGIGIYGVIAFSVNQRTHEIAVRMAVGATGDRVIALVLREGAILACIGTSLGLIGAYFVGRLMSGFLYGVHALDVTAFTLVSLVLLSAALLACYVPARRAASVEPMQALRME
jgi:ABC-type antimicrobial peptide transport system permease subunit